jgi:transposase
MAREALRIDLSLDEINELRRLANALSTPQALAFRARVILRCDSAHRRGVPRNDHIALALGCDPDTVAKWRRRFQQQRLAGLDDLPRSGRPAAFSPCGQA